IARESSGSDKQKAEVVEFLCHPEAATAICSAFYTCKCTKIASRCTRT
ncbi:hypothetical protein FE153_11805, partial [Streptococcus pneumoniae]